MPLVGLAVEPPEGRSRMSDLLLSGEVRNGLGHTLHWIATGIEILGVAVILLGVLVSTTWMARDLASGEWTSADSDEVAQAYRYEVARGFRDDVAHLSDLISPSGEAFWPAGSLASVKPRGQSGIATSTFFLLLRLLWACGQRDCVVQAQRHVHGAQVFRADCRVRRRLSPVRSSRWALWTRRSSTASA